MMYTTKNGVSKAVANNYVVVNGITKQVTNAYVVKNGITKEAWSSKQYIIKDGIEVNKTKFGELKAKQLYANSKGQVTSKDNKVTLQNILVNSTQSNVMFYHNAKPVDVTKLKKLHFEVGNVFFDSSDTSGNLSVGISSNINSAVEKDTLVYEWSKSTGYTKYIQEVDIDLSDVEGDKYIIFTYKTNSKSYQSEYSYVQLNNLYLQ